MRYFIFPLLIFALSSVFYSCALDTQGLEKEETLELALPKWPPESESAPAPATSSPYPQLSRWRIELASAQSKKTYYTTTETIRVTVQKNRPFCITAQPLTLLYDGKECAYFKPAGYLYTKSGFSWEQGYLAALMQKLFYQTFDNGFSSLESEYLISTFNWTKAQEIIEKKVREGKPYNPWLIPDSQLCEGIYTHNFKTSLLNLSGCLTLENPAPDKLPLLLSSFIPENNQQNLSNFQKNQFTVRKNYPIIIGDGKKYALYITAQSAKNISLEVIYLPIFIEDL